ncbi:hypothetical protein ACQ4M4_08990 [Leptolyngbya sp. AN02str]|uniref:hypothetical protein n=1 Tax=Leptolyngbya sp. AN02str TaxID=3423363 RepID=UPI003D30F15A
MTPSINEIFRLAQDRGCVLKIMQYDGALFYWVENQHFISKPYQRLDELSNFILSLPHHLLGETACLAAVG